MRKIVIVKCWFDCHDKQFLRLNYEKWGSFYGNHRIEQNEFSVTRVYFKCKRCRKLFSETLTGVYKESDFK